MGDPSVELFLHCRFGPRVRSTHAQADCRRTPVDFFGCPRQRDAARRRHGATIGTNPGGIANDPPRTVRSPMKERMKSSAVSGAELKTDVAQHLSPVSRSGDRRQRPLVRRRLRKRLAELALGAAPACYLSVGRSVGRGLVNHSGSTRDMQQLVARGGLKKSLHMPFD